MSIARDEQIGSYRVVRTIANGGMGVVYEAQHTLLPRRAALKVMHRELLLIEGSADRLLQEACILDSFRHGGVVQVYECGTLPDGRPWMAMELVAGNTLSARLARSGMLAVDQLVVLLGAVADILVAAHARGIVHRDLKPDNILVEGSGLTRVRLIDWGIATQHLPGPGLTLGDTTLGTPTYMAPEQARGLRVDGRCDIYALGVLAYEALTGAPPFTGASAIDVMMQHLTEPPPSLRAMRPDVPAYLAALIGQMLAKEPDQRPDARALRDALASFAATDEYDELIVEADVAFDELGPIDAADDADDADDEAYDQLELLAPTTELRLGQPRWTPQGLVAAGRPVRRTITPRSERDEVSGEVDTDA